jgi:hypothetical protein
METNETSLLFETVGLGVKLIHDAAPGACPLCDRPDPAGFAEAA